VPDDLGEERKKMNRPCWGNGLPGFQIGVVDTFLGVLVIFGNGMGNDRKAGTVFACGFPYGFFISLKEEIKDVCVFHGDASFGEYAAHESASSLDKADYFLKSCGPFWKNQFFAIFSP
jgi:hypothetical protein